VIDGFLKGIELKDPTRKAIFAMLRDSGKTKEDMYAAVGIDSLAVMSTASEYDGQRCIRWIKGETVEVRRGDQVNQEIKPMTFRPFGALPADARAANPADAIPGVDADPTTGKPLEFKTPATTPPILMPDAANVDDAEAQSAIDTLVERSRI